MADFKFPGNTPEEEPKPPAPKLSKLLGDDADKIDISHLPEMTVEDVDAFLAEEAPEFYKEVSTIGADKTLTLQQIVIDDTETALHAEIDIWRSYNGPLKLVFLVLPFMPKITLRLKIWKFKIVGWFQGLFIRLKNFAIFIMTDGRVAATEQLKLGVARLRTSIQEGMTTFRKISLRARLVFFFVVFLVVTTTAVVYLSLTKKFLPAEKEIYFSGFANHAKEAFQYDRNRMEPYIDNARAVQNLLLTKKFFVNLKPSPGAGPNPMGAFEFFIEGMSSDVVIEAKQNEPMIRDIMSSVISEMTYDELDTDEGKRLLCSRLQKEVSRVLNSGSVKNIKIKSIVIKP